MPKTAGRHQSKDVPLACRPTVTMQHAAHGRLAVEVEVVHTVPKVKRSFIDAVPNPVSFGYHITVSVTYDAVAEAIGDPRLRMNSRSLDPRMMATAWAGLEAYSLEGRATGFNHYDRRFDIAALDVTAMPDRVVEQTCGSWDAFLEQHYEAPEVAAPVLTLMHQDDGTTARRPLRDGGSLITLGGLTVHPMLRGQAVGLRLVVHALWSLVRHPGDLAILHAHPTESQFDAREEREGFRVRADDVKRIVTYAERLGFYRLCPEEAITRTTIVPMYRHVGAFGLPFQGLGSLSALAPELAQ